MRPIERIVAALMLLTTAAGFVSIGKAQTNAPGAIATSPVAVNGQFPYIGGPQSSGVNAGGGTFTCAASAATIANTRVTANSVIVTTLKTVGGTVAALFIATITPGTGFTVTCGGSDTSTYNYVILG